MTEGEETEPQYVERLEAHLRSRQVNTTVKAVGVGKDPLKVVRKCVELRDKDKAKGRGYQRCFCLVDKDQHASLDEALRLAAVEGIGVIVSNLKFEVWLRWHVENSFSALSSHALDSFVAKHNLLMGKALALNFPCTAVDTACARARKADPDLAFNRVGPDPSTAMPLLVDAIRGTGI